MNIRHLGIWQEDINVVAKKLVSIGYSEAYIQSVMYAGRDSETSINHIATAVTKAIQEKASV